MKVLVTSISLILVSLCLFFIACNRDNIIPSEEKKPEEVKISTNTNNTKDNCTCKCEGPFCSSCSVCVNGQTCSCSCSWLFGCSCTVCKTADKSGGKVNEEKMLPTISDQQKKNRISFENYLLSQKQDKLTTIAKEMKKMRLAVENKSVAEYTKTVEILKTIAKTLTQEEKTIIKKWFTDHGFHDVEI